MADDDIDFAVAAYREEGEWQLVELHSSIAEDVEELTKALKRFPSDVGVLALISVDDEFFVIVRVMGSDTRMMISDITTVGDWPLASAVADFLNIPEPDDDDDSQPGGDLDILGDFGMTAMELGLLCDDDDLYPDEVLTTVADRLGFAEDFETIIG